MVVANVVMGAVTPVTSDGATVAEPVARLPIALYGTLLSIVRGDRARSSGAFTIIGKGNLLGTLNNTSAVPGAPDVSS